MAGQGVLRESSQAHIRACMLVPAFNENGTIRDVVTGCLKHVPEVVVVDDGSNDGTGETARSVGARVITHEVNRGKGAALKTGFDHILSDGWEALIVIDSDGQHDCEEIPRIIETTLMDNAAITVGNRMGDVRSMPLRRKVVNWILSWIISKLAGQDVPDTQCGFRLIRSNVLRELDLSTDNFEMESEMIIIAARKGYRVSSVPIKTIYRKGRGRIGPVRDGLRFVKLFILYALGLK